MSRPDSNAHRTSTLGQRKRLQQLVVRVGTLPMAAAMALGATVPWAAAQTVITPLSGPAATQTLVTRAPDRVTVTTGTLRDGNAFNNFSAFQVGAGDRVGLVVPQGANWLVNVVRDARVQVDGLLQGQLANGTVGGNLLFIDRHGFAVGPQGSVQAGRLVFAAPSTAFVDGLLADGPGLSGTRVSGVLGGAFDRSDTGAVRIDGSIETTDGVQLMAGQGAGSAHAVSISGQVSVAGRLAGSAVNLGDLRSLAPVVVRDGVIDITTPGDIVFNGKLLADGSHWSDAGAVRVVAGGNISLGSLTLVSASAGGGSGAQGGTVSLFAHGSANNATGAALAARGDGVGAGGFIEFSAAKSVRIGGLTLDAGSDRGQAGLAYIDPEDLTVTGSVYTNGASLSLDASKTLQVNTGVTLNTRRVNGATASSSGVSSATTLITSDPLTRSVGNSGNITLTAPSIIVQAGATLDASVINEGGTTYQAGDITLTATQASSWETLISLADANAGIDVAGTLTGRNVTLEASIESAASFGGTSGSIQQEAINLLLGDLPFAASLSYVEAKGNATITVRPTAVLAATGNITLTALADRSVSVETEAAGSAKANLSAGFARVLGSTTIDVQGGASLTADGDIALVAASKTSVTMASSAAGETDEESGAANVASIVFAGSMSDVTTSVNVATGATLDSGGDVLLQAFHSGNYDTTAEVTVYGGGTAGVVGALSLQNSTTSVTVGGTVNAQGHVSLVAMNASAKHAIAASATNASEEEEESALAGLPESLEYSQDDAGAAAEAQLLDSFTAMTEAFSASSDEASGGTPSETKSPALRLAGAMTWSQSKHTTRASLAAGGVINAGGDAVVDAQTLVGQLQSVAMAEATSATDDKEGTKTSLAVAFNYADHSFTTKALVGAGASIRAGHVAVNASTDVPQFYTAGLPLDLVGAPVEWGTFSAAYETFMAGTDPLYDGFNTRVGATSSATNLAAAGAVSLSFMTNDTRAWVDTGAQITSTVADGVAWSYDLHEVGFESDLVAMLTPINTYSLDKDLGVLGDFIAETRVAPSGPEVEEISFSRSFDGAVVVRAENHVQTLHLAGGTGPEAGGSGSSVGGTFSMVSRDNTAVAGIADSAVIQTHRLDVAAETIDWVLSLSPTSGQGAGVAANGIASLNKFSETTRASISREAQVTAGSVNVNAQLSLGVIAVTGAVTKSENSGVGIGVAMNDMVGNTQATIGDNDNDNDNDTDGGGADTVEGVAGYVKTSQLAVQARSDGMIIAVGVAGAAAGQESPTDKSANKNLGEKAGTDSADTQAQLDGNDSTMAPLEDASAPIEGEGTDEAAAAEPAASKPPSFSIAGAGAIVTNYSDIDTTALLDGAVVRALDVVASTTTAVAVRALSDLTQVSVAGGGALSMAKNASTTFSAAVAGAVAIQDSDDDTSALIRNHTVVSDLADRSGALVVQAIKSGERTAVATGISLNLSKGSTTSLSVVGAVSATQTSDDTAAGIDGSTITGDATTPSALGVQVVAYDRTRIGAGGGALSVSTGKGSASAGAAISIVDMKGSTSAVLGGGTMTRVHDLAVAAFSSQKVVGMAAVATVQTDASSRGQLMGSFVFNQIGNTVGAGVKGAATVNLTGDLAIQAGGAPTDSTLDALVGDVRSSTLIDYEMASTNNGYTDDLKSAVGGESILGVAGTLGVTLGSNAASLGLSYVHNSIQTSYDAELNGSITASGDVSVQALSEADIVGVSVGLGATKGKFSGMGSASVNLIGQRTRALVTGGSVTAAGLDVTSQTVGNQFGLAGNLSIAVGGGSGNAAGAAVSYTLSAGRDYKVGGDTSSTRSAGNEASISDAEVHVGTGHVVVAARHTSDTQSVAASGAAADGTAGFAGTLSFTDVGGVTTAVVHNTDLTAGTVSVTAGEAADGRTASSLSVAGGLALSKGYAGALAVAWNTMSAVRSARITDSDLVVADSVTVESSAQGSIETLAVAVTAGKDGAGSGSIASNFMISDTLAEFSGGSLSGTATRLVVRSTGSSSIDSLAGAVSAGGTGAVGGALAINSVGEGADNFRVRARLADTTLAAPVAVTVASSLAGSIESIAASGSGAGTAAINGSVTVNTIEADVLTEVSGVTQIASGGSFKLSATNDADMASLAGTISGAGTGAVGAAVSVNQIGGRVTARLADSALRTTGAIGVDATSSGTIRSVAAGMSGGGSVALAGSNTTNAITSTVLAQMDTVNLVVNAASLTVLARDTSTIQSFAGTVAGGGAASGGAALALNFLGRTATNGDSSKRVEAEVIDSVVRSSGAVGVNAYSTSTIESAGVAAGASGTTAITGSNATNLLEDEITASWAGSELISTGTLTVAARQTSRIDSLAGNVSGSLGAAVGAAVAVNRIGTDTGASLVGMATDQFNLGIGHWTQHADDLVLSADSDNQINTIAVGMSAGSVGVQGSVAVSVIDSLTRATLGADGFVTNVIASDSVAVTASSRDRIRGLAGAVALGAAGVGAAGGVQTNIVTSTTSAGITGADSHVNAFANGDGLTLKGSALASSPNLMNINAVSNSVLDGASFVSRTVKGLAVQATSIQQVGALTAVAGGGAAGAAGASINVDQVGGSTRASIDSARYINDSGGAAATQTADVMAANHAMVASSVTALALGGTAGVSGSVATETIERSTRAEVMDGAIVNALGAVSVNAVSTNTVAQISAGAAGGGVAGVAGSGDVVLIRGETVALIDSATVRANSIAVVADGANHANLIAGSVGGGGAVGVGLSFTVAVSGSTVSAVVNDTTLMADGAVVVDADNRTGSLSVSASGAVGGTAGVAVGATVTVMEGATLAAVSGTSTVGRRTRATGLVAAAGDAPVTINLASTDDLVGTGNQTSVRFSLSNLGGRVNPASAVVTVTDGETTVTAVRQADGTYTANVSGLADGVLLAQVVLTENAVQKVSSTTMLKSTGINDLDDLPRAASLPAATTRISTLSGFDAVDARNHGAVRFVLKGAAGPTADSTAVVTVSDGTRSVTAALGADGSYTADVRSLGDGVLTALVTTSAGKTSRTTLTKASGAGSLSVTANEHIVLNSNAGQIGVGGVAGVGASANLVIGRSAVDASVNAGSVRVSDALTVSAARDADIDMITATAGGGGFVGVSGAVGVLIFGSAPDSHANSELTGSSSTLGQINTATQSDRAQGTGTALSSSETTALNGGGRYDTQGAFSGASGNHRTSATLAAQSIVAGSVSVSSLDRTVVDNNAGAIAAGGLAGVSAGVAVTLLGGSNHAGVSVGDLAVAGGVNIESGVRTPGSGKPAIESRAIAGAGGFVGVGAAVSVASNSTANTAVLAGRLSAGGAVSVKALDETSLLSEAFGSTAGVLSVGVVTATATQTGSVGTSLSGHLNGQGLAASAERQASATAQATGGSAGVYAGSGAGASASDSGAVSLTLATGTVLHAGSGDLVLSARANPGASTRAIGVSVGRTAGLGVSVAQSRVDTSVRVTALGPVTLRGADVLVTAVLGAGDSSVTSHAVAGGGGLLLGLQGAGATSNNTGVASVNLGSGATLGASGNVGMSANDSMRITANATGAGVGFVGAGVAVAIADSNTSVSTSTGALGGRVAGNLTVSARGDERVDADAEAGSGGVVAGAGADARVLHGQAVSATASTAAGGLTVLGVTTLSADRKVRYDSQTGTVNASAFGGSGAVTTATLNGSASAKLGNGSRLTGAQLRVLANNDVERTDLAAESARGGGGGVIAGAGASAITVINGTATAEIGDDVTLALGGDTAGLLELRAYNQLRGSSVGRLDLGGAIPIALVNTEIRSTANATAKLGARDNIAVAGEVYINALSYVDIEANTITKTYGAAAGAQGDALALADVTNQVTVGVDTNLVGEGTVTLLAGQDRDFWRNKSFVTARADLFNHAAVPVSVNPDVRATLHLNNNVTLAGDAVRSGGTIQLGGMAGSYVVEGKGKVNDWTRDVGELVGVSSEYGSSSKTLNANVALSGVIEAGFGNKQRVVIAENGSLAVNEGNIRYSIGTEDLAATGAAYLDTLYAQLKNYGSIPEVRAFVEAEIAFYMESLLREGFAALEADPDTGVTRIMAQENVPGTFITFQNVRAGSGNVELFGNNVTGRASITARADSEILIENNSPMNVRVKDLIIDSSGGFAKYNGTYLKASADIAGFNRDTKTGLAITVDSIDTRAAAGGGVGEELPTIRVVNNYVSDNLVSGSAVIATAPDGSWADLRQDQLRAPEVRVNGLVYNKLGPIILTNLAGSISVTQEDPGYVPRLDGLEVQVNAGKNFVLSSPSVSQSVGGSPESIYAVAYNDDQQNKLDNMGVVRCGTARAGDPGATNFNAGCLKNGTGGIYASGGIFLGARYLNINGTVQSGQSDFGVTLTQASVGTTIDNWERQWTANRGSYLAQGKSSLVQVAGRRSTDSESDINKNFANGSITQSQRNTQLAAMAARRGEPVVYYDAEDNCLKVASTEVTGGLVEVVGSIINTGGGVIRALDGYARFNIDNQTSYAMDLQGLDTGGDAGVVRITDLNRPVTTDGRISAYEVTTYERNAAGVFRSTTTAGRGAGAAVLRSSGSTLASPGGNRLATFSYAPVTNSTYVWSAGYEFNQEKRYWYQKSSSLWGAINLGSIKWNSIDIVTKDATAMPEGIYVTTSGAPSQNFTMSTQTFVTDGEQETYYRSWKKCGPLCFKKTYYVDYRTEVGKKDVFTQRVRADHPIAIEMVGYGTGLIDVKSNAGVRLSGNITNDSGLVSIDSSNGSIEQLSGGTAVTGNDLRFHARTGMGSEGAPINVVTGTGSFTAQSDSGNISFQSLGGALRINQVSTTGKVWLLGDEDIVGVNPNTVHVIGSRIELAAPRGGIGVFNADGSVRSTLNIQTQDSPGGGITASAARGIALKQATGNLWVNQIASNGGDVYIEAGGDLIDNNRNETRDVRTEAELLALWDAAALQGSSAQDSRQLTLRTTRSQFRRYWALRNATVTSLSGSTVTGYTADSLNADTYEFVYPDAERAQLARSGLSVAQITGLEAARTQEVKELDARYGATRYQLNDDLVIAEVNAANLLAGRPAVDALSTWSDAELQSPLPNAIFSKSSTDTQTRIEEPNVVGNRVVLRPGGKIGRDDGSVTIDLRKAGGLTTDDRLTIMSAETDDMSLDKTNWLLTVVKKDTFNVLSNRLNVNSSGFVYLGADTTDAHPTGGDANLEQVIGAGEVRIKVSGSILNAAGTAGSVIRGHKAILEAASGSIGTALKPVTLTLTGGGTPGQATLVARAQDGIWLSQTGDMRVADVYSPAAVSLTASGSIIDARGERTRSIEADGATLTALGGSVGSALQPMTVKSSLGSGVNASSALGYSIYLQGAETGLTVGRLSSGLDVDLYAAQGGLRVVGSTDARGRMEAEAAGAGDFTMASGTWLRALTGDIYVAADDVGLSQLDASRAVVVVARGALTDTSMDAVNVNVAGRGVTLTAAGSIGSTARAVDVLVKTGTRLVATTGGNAYLGSATSSLRIGQVSAVGNAVISSGYSILDDRGTRAQAVDAANLSFAAGGDVGQATAPMTVKTAVGGAVLGAVAGGSVHLGSSSGVLRVRTASAGTGQLSLNGGLAGLAIGGQLTSSNGLTLSAGAQALSLEADADLVNLSGNLVLQGKTIAIADGASVDGRAGSVVLSATGDITLTGIRSDNTSSGAIVVSTTAGSVLDGGDSAADMTVTSATGGIVVTAQGSVGNTALAVTAQGRSIETDAASLLVTSKTDSVSLAQTRATREVVISANKKAELLAQGSVVGTKVASLLGDVTVSSATGGVKLTSITSGQDVTIDAGGKIELVSLTTPRDITLSSSGQGLAGSGQGFTATSLSAGRNLSISARGANAQATLTSAVARSGFMAVNVGGELTMASATSSAALTLAAGGAATLNALGSSTGSVSVTAGSTLNFGTAKALQGLTMRSVGQLTGVSATSSAGTLDIASAAGGLKLATASAATGLTLDSAGALGVSSWASTGGAASITAQGLLTLGSGTASGQVAIRSRAEVSLGALSSVAGGITIESSHGPLTTGAVTAASNLSLSSGGALRAGALTSRNGSVQVESLTGSVALSSVSARTSVTASAGSSLAMTSFTVTAGGATLTASTDFSLTTGTATGAIGLTMGGQGSLGTVTSSASTLTARSTAGGMRFTALKSFGALTLRAAGALTSGTGVGYSLFGGTLDAGTSVDAQSTTGGIQITRLTARTASRFTTGSGALTISAISLLPKGLLVASTGSGKRTVPVGY